MIGDFKCVRIKKNVVTLSLLGIVCDDIKHLSFSNILSSVMFVLPGVKLWCVYFLFTKAKTSQNTVLLDKITTCTFST